MPKFEYRGKTSEGRITSGELEASSASQVAVLLRRQHIVPISIREKASGSILSRNIEIKLPFKRRVSTKELVVFTRQFATMIDAGLPLVQCLEILAGQQQNREFKRVLLDVKASVEEGSTLADALRKHPDVFDELFVNLVAAGEVGGILDTILNRLSNFMEKTEKLKGKIKGALTYPVVVIIIAILVVAGLLIWVVPIFEDMFASFGKALPLPTQIVVGMSKWLRYYWYIILGVTVVVALGVLQLYRTRKGRKAIDYAMLRLPVIGDLLKKTAIARFTRTLGTMLASGVPILEALDIVAKTTGNLVVEEAVMKAKSNISEGKTLAEPLAETRVFPPMVTQMITVGEPTGAMDRMLAKIADFYEDEVDTAVEALTSLIEPLLMVFLGLVVGGLVIALYLPIFQLAGAVVG